jgi:PAS domain S-box-containing protein
MADQTLQDTNRTVGSPTSEPGPAGPSQASVLLVDDRVENLVALEAILEPLGLRLIRATSAEEALRAVLRYQFAVILLDVLMPGTDGLETARLIKQRTRSEHVPIIFLTALDRDRRIVTLGYESGAVDYLFKPLDPNILRAKVSAFVELERLHNELAELKGRRFADLARKESEERYRLVQMATNDVIWDWNLTTDALHLNEQAEVAFRMGSSALPADGRSRYAHIHPDDRARVMAGIQAVIGAPAGTEWSDEYRFLLGDGSYRVFLDRAYVARKDDGTPLRMIGAMQDITERAQASAAAETARVAAEEANRLKSEFLATMSHEFRTPLNAIVGYAQLLDMGILGPATPAQHEHLQRLQASARHLLGLVEDVLDIARVDADRLNVRREALSTGATVAAAVNLVQPQATMKGVRLFDHCAGGPGPLAIGDEHRVRQILVNLLANAIKFTPAGGQVTVSCDATRDPFWRTESDGGTWAYLQVADTGPGVPPGMIDRVFEPFVQGDAALTREQGGTGLGLAISRRLARLMNGEITARSDPGSGATFTLWLPTPDETEVPPARDPVPEQTSPEGIPDRAHARALGVPGSPLNAASYTVLHALGSRLAAHAETIAERYVAALRADPWFPGATTLPEVQLRDHVTPFVSLLAAQLMTIGETRGEAHELLGDGGQLQRMMSELHGAQRQRLGWSEVDIERETQLLIAEVERSIQDALATTLVDGPLASIPIENPETTDGAVRVAAQYARDVTRHVLEQATRTAVRAYRVAKASDAP